MTRIFWAGDSTVKYNKINTYPQTGMGQVLNLYLRADIEVCNYAENGRSTKSFIDEGRLDQIDKEIKEKDFLFIQFGHNDQKDDIERYTDPFGTYQENLNQFIDLAKKHGAYPVLITPLSRRIFDKNGLINTHSHFDYPKAAKSLAKQLGVPCIDLSEKSRKIISKSGDLNSRRWFMHLKPNEYKAYPQGLEDNTHLNYQGAVVMAGLVAEGLMELGGVYAKLLLMET